MTIKNTDKKELFDEKGGLCQRCKHPLYLYKNGKETHGKRRAYFHHIIHRSEGRTDEKNNLLLTCWNCEKIFHRKYNVQNRPVIVYKRNNKKEI